MPSPGKVDCLPSCYILCMPAVAVAWLVHQRKGNWLNQVPPPLCSAGLLGFKITGPVLRPLLVNLLTLDSWPVTNHSQAFFSIKQDMPSLGCFIWWLNAIILTGEAQRNMLAVRVPTNETESHACDKNNLVTHLAPVVVFTLSMNDNPQCSL